MKTWDVYFSPVGEKLATVKADRKWEALTIVANKFNAKRSDLEAYEVSTPDERDREENGVGI